MDVSSTRVGLLPCSQYDSTILRNTFDGLLAAVDAQENYRSLKILLKPNLISARLSPLACTEGQFILTAATMFSELGACVTVGDSPAFGTAHSVLEKIGILKKLLRMNIAIDDFAKAEQVTLSSGIKVGLAAGARNCDLLVNLPRVKAHAQLLVTLAVKNYFGCVVGMRKPYWHMRYGDRNGSFEHHLVELLSVLPDSLVLADGITAMHQTGPIGGKPYSLGMAACSRNPVALDRAVLDILSINPGQSPLFQACVKKRLTGTDISKIEFPLSRPDQLRVDNFAVPVSLHPVRFNPVRYVKSNMTRIISRMK